MPVSLSRSAFGIPAFFCGVVLAAVVAQAQEPRFEQDKAIDVEVKIVPFYAVDSQGRPVYDLKPEDVEIRVGGVPVKIQSFDRYAAPGGSSPPRAGSPAPPLSRTVYLLFDIGFSSPTGLNMSQKLASDLVQGWPGADRLHLMVNSETGLKSRLGPVAADRDGKRKLLAEIQSLQPEVQRLHLGLDNDFGPTVGGISGSTGSQMEHNYDAMRASSRGEYHSAARSFAESMEVLASDLRRLSGPKLLLIFSQGVDPELYFDGDTGNAMGSDESIRITTRRAPPLLDRFKGPLDALTDSGVLTLFVNTTQQAVVAENALRHMAKTTGGLYLDGVNNRKLEQRITASTAAYYEAGFQPTITLLEAERAGVEVILRRPGARALAPAAVRTRETYRGLSEHERKMLVVDLISGGPEAQRSRGPVRLDIRDLAGRPRGGGDAAKRSLRFDIDWPQELSARKFDLYNVVLARSGQGQRARIVRFDQQQGVEVSTLGPLEAAFESQDDSLWGIVAIDPETNRAWFRRLRVQPEGAKQ